MKQEIWKQIEGCIGYEISSNGRVKSLPKSSGCKAFKEIILVAANSSRGYLQMPLLTHGESKTHKLHRLVAQAFIDNPNALNEVNHINGNKKDNRVENLEWVTHKENMQHAQRTGLVSNEKAISVLRKRVIDRQTNVEYVSIAEAARQLGMVRSTLKNMLTGHRQNKTSIAYL